VRCGLSGFPGIPDADEIETVEASTNNILMRGDDPVFQRRMTIEEIAEHFGVRVAVVPDWPEPHNVEVLVTRPEGGHRVLTPVWLTFWPSP